MTTEFEKENACESCGHYIGGHSEENGCLTGWMSLFNPGAGISFCGCKWYPEND